MLPASSTPVDIEAPRQPATTVSTTFELTSGLLTIGCPGLINAELLERNPGAGILNLEAVNGKWRVEVDAALFSHDIPREAMRVRAAVLDANGTPIPAAYSSAGFATSYSLMVGIFDSKMPTEAGQGALFAQAQASLKPNDATFEKWFNAVTQDSPLKAHSPNSEVDTPLKDLFASQRETSRESLFSAVGNLGRGVTMFLGVNGGLFNVSVGYDLSARAVSVDIDFETIPTTRPAARS